MSRPEQAPPPIILVTGGVGASADQLLNTVLAQFPDIEPEIIRHPHVRQLGRIDAVVSEAVERGAPIIHTLVDARLRVHLVRLAARRDVVEVDLMGPVMDTLAGVLRRQPLGIPGLYRKLNRAYFSRVEAIEFTMDHDDGMKPEDLLDAEIVLVGLSRAGKTPLSMYLAVLGWKVSNVALVPGAPLPEQLFDVDRRRVFGLAIESELITTHRRKRINRMKGDEYSSYIDPATVFGEIEEARTVFRRGGFTVIDVSYKPIETSADEIIEYMTRRFGAG